MAKYKGRVVSFAPGLFAMSVSALALSAADVSAQATPVTEVTGTQTVPLITTSDVDLDVTASGVIDIDTSNNTVGVALDVQTYSSTTTNDGTIDVNATGAATEAFGIVMGTSTAGFPSGTLSGTIQNNGSISVALDAASSTGVTAMGIAVGDISGTVSNTGEISIDVDNSSGQAFGMGIFASGGLSGSLANDGSITVLSDNSSGNASAIGMRINGETSGMITNAGTITLDAAASRSVFVYGIDLLGTLSGQAENAGTVDIDFDSDVGGASVTGIYVGGDVTATGSVENSGTIDIDGTAETFVNAFGIFTVNDIDGTVTNSGNIAIDVTANNGNAVATGIHINDDVNPDGSVTNSGNITIDADATGRNAQVAGIFVDEDVEGTIENAGTIDVSATGRGALLNFVAGSAGDASADSLDYSSGPIADAYGIDVDYVTGSVTNSGDMTVSALGVGLATVTVNSNGTDPAADPCCATSSSANAVGIGTGEVVGGTVSNSGSIDVSAHYANGSSAFATGIGTDDLLGGTVSNSGSINVVAGSDTGSAPEMFAITSVATGIAVDDVSGDSMSTPASEVTFTGTVSPIMPSFGAGTIENTGDIDVSAFGAFTAASVGIEVDEMDGTLTNAGDINVSAMLGGDRNTVVLTSIGADDYSVFRAGNIGAVGIAVGENGGSVTNAGTITVDVEGDIASGRLAAAGIGGFTMYSGATLENSGLIQVTADVPNFGNDRFRFGDAVPSMGSIISTGTIGATPNGVAGILISGDVASGATIEHSGTIDVSTTAGGIFGLPPCLDCMSGDNGYLLRGGGVLTVGIGAGNFDGVLNVTGDIFVDGPQFGGMLPIDLMPGFPGRGIGLTYGIYLPSGTGTLNITTESTINAPILVNGHDVNLDAVGGSRVYFFQDLDTATGVFETTVSDGRSAWFVEDEGGSFPIYATIDGGEAAGGFTGQELADLGRVFDGIDAIFNPPGFNRAKKAAHADSGFSTFVLGDGVHRSYSADGSNPEVRTNVGAVIVGATTEMSSGTQLAFSMGILGASADDGTTDVDTSGVVLAANVGFDSGPWTISAGLGLGFVTNDSTRRITGSTDANGAFDSRFVSASLAASRDMTLGGMDVKAFGRLRHTYQNADGYTETGSTANATVAERSTSVTELRLGAEVEREVGTNTKVRAGLAGLHRAVSGDDVVDVGIFGSTQTIATGAEDFTGAEVTLGFEHDMGGGAVFDLEAVQNFGSGQTDLSLSAGIKINF
ncbi:MAG: autotransporter outer membrane beta-barrel domain-containing protein [Pseudomonadota bacterium]